MNINEQIYQEVTDRIIAKLEAGTVPWRQPWTSTNEGGFLTAPRNLVSKKSYRGINVLMLATAGFSSPWWMTYKQATELGGNVKRGEKSNMVVFFKKLEKTDKEGNVILDENGKAKVTWMLRYSRVFNLEQTEGVKAPVTEQPVVEGDAAEENDDTLAKAKQIVAEANLCPISNGGNVAAYSPTLDRIRMPKIKAFKTPASYYHVLFHEMTHATGHASRLARFETGKANGFGSEEYSKEELVAEIGASFLSNVAGIFSDVQFENSAGYIQNWLQALKDDPKMVVKAASAAQRAADLILHIKREEA